MKTKETIYEKYTREKCKKCKNKERCQEELHKRIDGTIRCDHYEGY